MAENDSEKDESIEDVTETQEFKMFAGPYSNEQPSFDLSYNKLD